MLPDPSMINATSAFALHSTVRGKQTIHYFIGRGVLCIAVHYWFIFKMVNILYVPCVLIALFDSNTRVVENTL